MALTYTDTDQERVKALVELGLLDGQPRPVFDHLVRLLTRTFAVPTAFVSMVELEKQVFLARHGLDFASTPRDIAFCDHTIRQPEDVMVIPDARLDPRFAHNPLVTGKPHIRFYAGAPVTLSDGRTLGTVCLVDSQPREFSREDMELLKDQARFVAERIEAPMFRAEATIQASEAKFERAEMERLRRRLNDGHQIADARVMPLAREVLRRVEEGEGPNAYDGLALASMRFVDAVQTLGAFMMADRVFELETVDLRGVVAEVLHHHRDRIEQARAVVVVGELPTVTACPDRLRTVFTELLTNALEASDSRPLVISLDADVKSGIARIVVRDNGRGIRASEREAVFLPLYRCEATGSGTGMGLTVVRAIVDGLGGKIGLRSQVGSGTEVWLELAAV